MALGWNDLKVLMTSTKPADYAPPVESAPETGADAEPAAATPAIRGGDEDVRGATPKHSARLGGGPAAPVATPKRTLTHIPSFTREGINLASARLGARVVSVTDDFFAAAPRMLSPENPVWKEGVFDDHGKWMDGWESRRRRTEGHDHAVIALACAGRVSGFDVDTSFFTGNYPPHVMIEGANLRSVADDPDEGTEWFGLIGMHDLGPNANHFFYCERSELPVTHLRVHIYPDGGIARLRCYGTPIYDWRNVGADEEVDLVHAFHGGRSVDHSDAHYGHPERMLGPGRGVNMGDGWETARRRGPGHDWSLLRLGHPGTIRRVIVDTAHFKGNYPHHCTLRGTLIDRDSGAIDHPEEWPLLLPDQILGPDAVHEFTIEAPRPVSHVRFEIHPDGGVSRLRLMGTKWTGE